MKPIDESLKAFQRYLQLKAPSRVFVPFVKELANVMGSVAGAPRINRDFARLISLIKSVALIRQHNRQVDSQGRIIATLEDYWTVRKLVNDMYIDSSSGITAEVRKLVEAVIELNAKRNDSAKITAARLRDHLAISKSAVSRWAQKGIKGEWIINQEIKRGYPADYIPGEPLPDTQGLPTLADCPTVPLELKEGGTPVLDSKTGDCSTVSPLTDGNALPLQISDESQIDTVLGMSVQKAIEVWRTTGAPVIHLESGINCLDLEVLLASPNSPTWQLVKVKEWLEQRP
jgi:hypothetical protein